MITNKMVTFFFRTTSENARSCKAFTGVKKCAIIWSEQNEEKLD